MEKMIALILAAGKGTRMNEGKESEIPKVMFQINNEPIIRHSVRLVQNAGIKKIVLVVGYKKELIKNYFGDEVDYVVQEEQLGTGHAAMIAKEKLWGRSESLIIFYGDNCLYRPETVKKLIDLYEKERPTIAMLTAITDDPTGYGRVFRDEKGDVIGITEHKDCTPEELKNKEWNPGFYILDSNWFWENITKLKPMNSQKEYYLTDMIVLAREQNKRIVAMPVSEESEAEGVNTQEQLQKAEQILQNRSNRSKIDVSFVN
ncbi:MAG: sugar phosphate nucleotidyltransferase [Patescibacteria group bacterium]